MPLTVTRLDARYHAPERLSVAIPEEVFGIRSWPSGPTWILDPPRSVRERALRHIKESFRDREPALFAAEGRIHVEALRDAHDRAVPGLEAVAGEAWLFFADLSPLANWSHECAYIVVRDHGEPIIAHHRWPPSDAVRLLPIFAP